MIGLLPKRDNLWYERNTSLLKQLKRQSTGSVGNNDSHNATLAPTIIVASPCALFNCQMNSKLYYISRQTGAKRTFCIRRNTIMKDQVSEVCFRNLTGVFSLIREL